MLVETVQNISQYSSGKVNYSKISFNDSSKLVLSASCFIPTEKLKMEIPV
jgi:hypothetical protein